MRYPVHLLEFPCLSASCWQVLPSRSRIHCGGQHALLVKYGAMQEAMGNASPMILANKVARGTARRFGAHGGSTAPISSSMTGQTEMDAVETLSRPGN